MKPIKDFIRELLIEQNRPMSVLEINRSVKTNWARIRVEHDAPIDAHVKYTLDLLAREGSVLFSSGIRHGKVVPRLIVTPQLPSTVGV